MTTLFAPPQICSAYSCSVDGSDPDSPLAKGTYLRLFAGLGASFPLTPFAVFKITMRRSEPHGIHVTDRTGAQAATFDLSKLGVVTVTPRYVDDDRRRTVRTDFAGFPVGSLKGVQLLDGRRRVVAERDRDPFQFSAPLLRSFRLWGGSNSVQIATRVVTLDSIVSGQVEIAADHVLSLPVEGLHPWYLGVNSRNDGLQRVKDGAPRRLNPMDQPDGPFDPVSPDDEGARVEAMLAAGDLDGLLSRLVDDEGAPPWGQRERQVMNPPDGGKQQIADVPRLGNLQTGALDPGIARYLGFAEHIDDLPAADGEGWDALAVAAVFAIDPASLGHASPLAPWLHHDPDESRLVDSITRALSTSSGNDLRNDVDAVIHHARDAGLLVRALVAVTAPISPPNAPNLPVPDLVMRRWQTPDNHQPSNFYRAGFAFSAPPMTALAAMAALQGGTWVPRHDSLDVEPHVPSTRSTPRIFGHEVEAFSRARELGLAVASAQTAGLLADHDISADGATRYRFYGSDFFGRFGDPVEVGASPPTRPSPPPPVLRYHLERADVDPASSNPVSPGTLVLTFAVPAAPPAPRFSSEDEPRLASAIAVPSIDELPAGALVIEEGTVALEGESRTLDLSTGGLTDVTFPLPELAPQETITLTLSATFTDSDGTSSDPAVAAVTVTDMRPPVAIPTGIGLFWTSAPGPAPETELKLSWPAAPGSLYRVYSTDQQGLGLTAADLGQAAGSPEASRAQVGVAGSNKVLGGAPVDRRAFRLLTASPLVAGGDSRALLQTTLPRSLETVQFVRVVPLTGEGAEAPFDTCGIVPVAVPTSRRPPAPRLEASIDAESGAATLTVVADGFDAVALRRDEPGLFTPGQDGSVPPEFRIRRSVGPVADPIYARPAAGGSLQLDSAAEPRVVFTATATDNAGGAGLEPFVQYVYWATVRLPPERRIPPGVVPVDPPGGITASDGSAGADRSRSMSLPSAPQTVMRVPAAPPAAPPAASLTATREGPDAAGAWNVTIGLADPPTVHPRAMGPYRLAVWTQWPGQPIEPISVADGTPLADGVWPDLSSGAVTVTVTAPPPGVAAASPITLRVGVVDPVGRMSALTQIDV